MPYIEPSRRAILDRAPRPGMSCRNVGELTYVLYRVALDALPEGPKYTDYAIIMAALENAKQEFYRKEVAPYEDTKIEANGDIE